MNALRVDIWSDIACPWCWVGKRRLEAAMAQFPHPVEVVWRAFELDPAAPTQLEGSVDLVQRLAAKYRTSRQQAQAMIDRMTRVGADDGLDFRFDRARPTNTFDAHRLLHWAAAHPEPHAKPGSKPGSKQDALKERLFRAYMHEGRSVADHGVLVELAAGVGLSPDGAQAVLSSRDHAQEVRADEALAAELGITGVPFFVIGGRYAVSGAQPAEMLLQVLQRAWNEHTPAPSRTMEAEADEAAAEVCGPDGCPIPSVHGTGDTGDTRDTVPPA